MNKKIEIRIRKNKNQPWMSTKIFATINFLDKGLEKIEEQIENYVYSLANTKGVQVRWNLKGSKEGIFIKPQK